MLQLLLFNIQTSLVGIEPLKEIEEIAHKGKSLFVVSSNPLALGVLNTSR